MLHIAYDRELSTEFDPLYFVWELESRAIVYKGTYTQCLVVVGADNINPEMTLQEINEKTNGFLY